MSTIALTLRQLRYENRSFWRNPQAAGFTFAFPLMFMVLFDLLFGQEPTEYFAREVDIMNYYVPAIVVLSVVTACFTNIAISLTLARDRGELKRLRGTPLPPGAYLAARILHASFLAVLLVIVVTAAGALFYNVEIPTTTLPAFGIAVVVGAAAFCALGLAMSGMIPNGEAAPPMAQFAILPIMIISGIFFPTDQAPEWLQDVAGFLPVRPYLEAALTAFDPFTEGSGFAWNDLLIVAAWMVVGIAIAARKFSWEPRR